MADDNIPTMIIRPASKQAGQGGTDPDATKPWTGGKLSYADMVRKWKDRGYSDAGARGMADNMMRESSGDPTAIGPGGAAIGLFQHEGDRRTKLEQFAKQRGTKPTDPDTQIDFADNELKTDYPTLRGQLQTADNRAEAEDRFKRVFERPKSVLWGERPPKTETPDFRFSPYAMGEHAGRPNTDVVWMKPDDYLDLAPALGGRPFDSPAGRSLLASVDRGDPIEAIPSLDVDVKGNTGTVTDQDGRHRALLAKHAGVDAIPVAIQKTGKGEPTELAGMSGKVLPNAFPKVEQPEAQKSQPRSMLQRVGDAIIPRAEAGEPAADGADGWVDVGPRSAPPSQPASDAGDGWIDVAQPQQAEPDNALVSGLKGADAGFARTVFGAQQLLGKGLQAAGATGAGEFLVNDANQRLKQVGDRVAADEKAHPYATGIGDFVGGMALPGGAAGVAGKLGGKLVGNAMKAGIAGAAGGLVEPENSPDYWRQKLTRGITGGLAGATVGTAFDMLGGLVAPNLREAVQKLMSEGVQMTPGQMAGGSTRRAEDILASVPLAGSVVRQAQRRSIDTFNRAAINRSLEDIGKKLPDDLSSGFGAINWAQRQFKQAYDQVLPNMTGIRDPVFVQNLNDVVNRAAAKKLPPEYQSELRHAIQTEILDRFDLNGRITGDQAQNIGTRLDEIIKPLKIGNVYQQQLAQHLRAADKVLDDMMGAHNPTMQAAKERIDAGYSKFKIVQLATKDTAEHTDGAFTPAELSKSVMKQDRTKDKAAFRRGEAQMQDLATAAREVLPTKVPDSGTPERIALMGVLTGAAPFSLYGAAGVGALSLPYFAAPSRLTNAMIARMAQNPGPTKNALAEILRLAGTGIAGSIPSMTIHPRDRQ